MPEVFQEIVSGYRQLGRHRKFWVLTLGTIALGIGALTAVFSIVDAVLLASPPYPEAPSLFSLSTRHPEYGENMAHRVDSYREMSQAMEPGRLEAVHRAVGQIQSQTGPLQLQIALTSPGFLETFGARLTLGHARPARGSGAGEGRAVVLSHRLWRDAFGGDRGILGHSFRFTGNLPDTGGEQEIYLTVAGVLAPEFEPPFLRFQPEIWAFSAFAPPTAADQRVALFGRLAPGQRPVDTEAKLGAVFGRLQASRGERDPWRLSLTSLPEYFVRDLRRPISLLFLGGLLVLLVATANAANLMMARIRTRADEVAIRFSLGASRWRLCRLFLLESIVPSLVTGVLGILLAKGALVLCRWLDLLRLPPRFELSVSGRAFLFAAAISLGAHLLVSLLPALRMAGSVQLASDIGRSPLSMGFRQIGGTRHLLLAVQVCLALVIAACSLLLVSSVGHLRQAQVGFSSADLFTARLALPSSSYARGVDRSLFYQRLVEALESQPDVERAGVVNFLPLGGGSAAGVFAVESPRAELAADPIVQFRGVSPGYFEAMRIGLEAGRFLEEKDLRTPAMVVSAEAAKLLWGDRDPLGQRLKMGGAGSRNSWARVVGVVADVKHDSIRSKVEPTVYLPFLNGSQMAVVARAKNGQALDLTATVQGQVRRLDPTLPLFDHSTMGQRIDADIARERITAALMSILTWMTIFLAAVGVYGAIWHTVVEKRQEVGIRMALGASQREVWWMFFHRAGPWVSAGMMAGLVLALAVSAGGLRDLLYQVGPFHPGVHALAFVGVGAIAVVATYLPTRRAANLPPAEVLKEEASTTG